MAETSKDGVTPAASATTVEASKVVAAEAPKVPAKKAPRSKKEQTGSFKVILRYLKAESFQFVLGMTYLFLGQAADFCVPLFIGFVMTAIEKGEFEKIGTICW